jgi:hypothetical protein
MLLGILGRYPAAEVLRWRWGGRHGIPEAEDEEGSPRLCAVLERGLVSDPGDSGRSPRGDPGGGHAHESFGGSLRGGPHANTLTLPAIAQGRSQNVSPVSALKKTSRRLR